MLGGHALSRSILIQVRNENGQVIVRVVRSNVAKTQAAPAAGVTSTLAKSQPEQLDELGLPIMDCTQPAPWTKAPAKTYKQVRILHSIPRYSAFHSDFILDKESDVSCKPAAECCPNERRYALHLGLRC